MAACAFYKNALRASRTNDWIKMKRNHSTMRNFSTRKKLTSWLMPVLQKTSIQSFLNDFRPGKVYNRHLFRYGQLTESRCAFKIFHRLPGKVSDRDIALVWLAIENLLTRQKVIFPLSGKVVFIWEKHFRLSISEILVHGKTFRLIWTQCNFSYYFYNKVGSRL